jgi:hypothetical protein
LGNDTLLRKATVSNCLNSTAEWLHRISEISLLWNRNFTCYNVQLWNTLQKQIQSFHLVADAYWYDFLEQLNKEALEEEDLAPKHEQPVFTSIATTSIKVSLLLRLFHEYRTTRPWKIAAQWEVRLSQYNRGPSPL